jgi:hypothetical protein
MSSVIGDFVCGTRQLLSQGFRSLPAILGGASLTLGMTQGNFNFIFFFVGMFLFTPIAAGLVNMLWELIFSNVHGWFAPPPELWKLPNGDAQACSIFTIGGTEQPTTINVVPSYWMTMMAFFFVYLFENAYRLYIKQQAEKAPSQAVMARKAQALISMIVIGMIGVVCVMLRYATACETGFGVFLSILLGGYMAHGWYKFMRVCGLGKLEDLFGISSRILPLQSYEELEPTVCIPVE